ncbi:hypothetical protein MVEN_01190300 [Mycena venus]|uniref:Uncharacterized protein n=1 Tax=Mycena venus TaxID=2733690 RepID=A0A8H6Y5E7_9AGAR|nr:hypothetical protein MVEN_01190300 [Mycena venus]
MTYQWSSLKELTCSVSGRVHILSSSRCTEIPQTVNMTSLLPAESQLLAQFLECIFWGLNIVTLGFCLQALLRTQNRWKRAEEISKPMLCVAIFMGCVATFDMCLTFVINLNAFVFYDGPGGPKAAFDNTSGWLDVMGTVDVIVQTVLGDVMLIYRCWIVYGRSWLAIAVPVIFAIAGLVCIGLTIFLEITLPAASQFSSPYKQVVISTWALTICINVTTTSLILWRIWRVDKQNIGLHLSQNSASAASKSPYHNARRIIIESGLMYTIVATTTAIVYICGSNAFAPLTGIDVQMIGIAFNLILIRVHRNRAAALKPHSVFGQPPASTLRFGVCPETSLPSDTALGDMESNHSLDSARFGGREGNSDVSTSFSGREKTGRAGEEKNDVC